jgi:hypothetical protein
MAMRLISNLSFIIVFTVAPMSGQAPPPCEICKGTLYPETVVCDHPVSGDWGSENCKITIEGTRTTCESPTPPACLYYEPPPPPPPPPVDDGDNCSGQCSPIIIDVEGDGYDLTDAAHGVAFDIDGDGLANRLSWTRAGSDDAFLWLDTNGNGVVDSGAELFGDAVRDNGFDMLKTFDANGDGIVDRHDAIWPSLRLWLDSNHNGISEATEISFVASSRFTGIGVQFKIVGKRDKYGNSFRYKGRVYASDDQNGAERVYDIILAQAK